MIDTYLVTMFFAVFGLGFLLGGILMSKIHEIENTDDE